MQACPHPVRTVLRNGISGLVAQKVKAELGFLKVQLFQQPVATSQEQCWNSTINLACRWYSRHNTNLDRRYCKQP